MNEYPLKASVKPADANVYCPEWWRRVYIEQINDDYIAKPCCVYRNPLPGRMTDPNTLYTTYNQSQQIIRFRQDNLNGVKNPGCGQCYETESRGQTSSRQYKIMENGTSNVEVTSHLDLNLGNLCNLSCAVCGPWNSTSWAALAPRELYYIEPHRRYRKQDRPAIDDPELFLSLKTVQLQGGEVFLEPNYLGFFQNLGKYRTYNDLSVTIFTNGTVRPSPEFMQILNQCGRVDIYFSIDDIEQRFEYQRNGAKWSEVLSNIHWFRASVKDSIHLYFNTTYSLLNVYYLADLHRRLTTEFPGMGINYSEFNNQPNSRAQFSADRMTANVRQICLDRVAAIPELSFLSQYISTVEGDPYSKFKDYIRLYDGMIKKSYAETHPEFYQLI
jgi:hypothetical protein